MKTQIPSSLHELTNHPAWDTFRESRLGNDLWFQNPERADRIHKAAEDGADGSTHAEVIRDQRDFLCQLARDAKSEIWASLDGDELDKALDALEASVDALETALDNVEAFHAKAGTLYEEIG